MRKIIILIFVSSMLSLQAQFAQGDQNNRAIILTDVENEPDDSESLVRLMLYSNVIDIKGIIATTSTHMRNVVRPAQRSGVPLDVRLS